MNQAYCPECQTELTKSIVGYLCHGCGSVYGFEKHSGDDAGHSGNSTPTVVKTDSSEPKTSSFARHQPHIHDSVAPQPKPSKIKHHVKKFVVPQFSDELPKPTDEEHMLPAGSDNDSAIAGKPSEKVMPLFAAPKSPIANADFNADSAKESLNYPENVIESQRSETIAGPQSYLLPAIAGLLAVAALTIVYLLLR